MMADIVPLNAWKGKLSSSKQGFKKNMTNLMICLSSIHELGNTIKWNELAQRVEWNGAPLEDHHLVDIQLILERNDYEPAKGDIFPAVLRHARQNAYHPVRDYLRSLKWDGTPRLDHWLQQCLGAEDSKYNRLVGRKTLIAAVARAFKPGCKVDTILILEGEQGIKKSTAIATLFSPELTAESVNLFDQHNKMVMSMMGAWCVELAEFVAFFQKDKNLVKGMITMRSDKVVLPYAKVATEHPRQCVMFGTYNPTDGGYFTDTTGNRRYWPVKVTNADIALIASRRDQIWAEAYRAFLADEPWWLEGEEEEALAHNEVAEREESDVWEEILTRKLDNWNVLTISEALAEVGIPAERMDRRAELRAAKVLRKLGYVLKIKKIQVAGQWKSIRRWERVA